MMYISSLDYDSMKFISTSFVHSKTNSKGMKLRPEDFTFNKENIRGKGYKGKI